MIRIGVSGWSYDHWRGGPFYPKGLPRRRELAYTVSRFNTVEVNGSFYGLLKPDLYRRYRETAPEGFLYAVKASRYITHRKRLSGVEKPVANFFASGLLRLEEMLGPILWQLPPAKIDPERLARLLDLLPHDTHEMSRIARRHDARVKGRASMVAHENRAVRHAFELRHPRHLEDDVLDRFRAHGTAVVFADSGDWPYTEERTADFVYVRLHGSPKTYASNYGDARLDRWAGKIRRWARGSRDVYCYFDNDGAANAPRNARKLMDRMGVRATAAA